MIVDMFSDECDEDAAAECSELRPYVPLSEQFDSEEFESYCRYVCVINRDAVALTGIAFVKKSKAIAKSFI